MLGVHVSVHVLCRLYMCCAGRLTTQTRCAGGPCGCTCVVQAVHVLCRSFNYTDEMCWGSMWLYKATGEDKYLAEARKWFDGSADWGMSWDDKIVGCQVDFLCSALYSANVPRLPFYCRLTFTAPMSPLIKVNNSDLVSPLEKVNNVT